MEELLLELRPTALLSAPRTALPSDRHVGPDLEAGPPVLAFLSVMAAVCEDSRPALLSVALVRPEAELFSAAPPPLGDVFL